MCKVLRINLETLPDSLPLEELGLDSLFAIELQTTVAKEFGVNLSISEIMSMTIGQLKSARRKENYGTIKRQLGEAGQLKKYLSSLSYSLAPAPLEALNSVKLGEPVYLVAGIHGVSPSMRALAGKLNAPLFALNLTRESNLGGPPISVNSIAAYYRQVLQAQNPTRRHLNLLAFDESSLLAMAILSSAGLSSHLCVIEKETPTNAWETIVSKDDAQLIDLLLGTLLAGSGQGDDTVEILKERLMRSVKKEESLEGKVKALSSILISYQANKEKAAQVEEYMEASVGRIGAIAREAHKLTEKRERRLEGWLTALANTRSHLCLLQDAPSQGLLSTHLKNCMDEVS